MSADKLLAQANKLRTEGKHQEAGEIIDQLLTQNQDHPVLLSVMAEILMRGGKQLGSSIALFHRALDEGKKKGQEPSAEVLSNLGLAYKFSGQPDKAMKFMKQAIDLAPESAGVLSNYGSSFVETNNPDEGRKYLERSIKSDPSLAIAHWNLSLCLLGNANESNEWGRAWDEYEWGQHDGGMRVKKKHVPLPDWDGTPGKKVLLYGEQGIGDEIMFASMLPDVLKTNEVILDSHSRLTTLFENSFGVRCYGTRKHQHLDWIEQEKPDYICALGSLGRLYRRSNDSFPGTPYLKAEAAPKGEKFRVGISWTGGRLAGRVAKRTVPLNWWRSILNVPDVEFVSLQYTDGCEAEIESVERLGYSIRQEPAAKAEDYNELAKFVASCDLIITVCTSVVHLAGALGVPCWVMVPTHAAWRYQKSGRMPWYRSVRLYRQPASEEGAWIPVVQRIGLDLSDLVAGKARMAA